VAHCGPDPHYGRQPIRTHRSDLSIVASNRLLLEALLAALAERAARAPAGRRAVLEPMLRRLRPPPQAAGDGERIDKIALNRALREVRPPGAVVFSEYWVRPDILASTVPGTYFAHPPAGGLGWGLPAAIGWQHARPGDTVIAAVGDGAYLFANPAACHHVMAAHGLPVLTVVCSNGKWGGVERSAWELHPGGHAATAGRTTPYAALGPLPAFEDYARASTGFGLRVAAPDELVPALRTALAVVRDERRHALVNVECA
jgi:acetolactate synthase-1/2/3 large subunit